MTQIQGLNFENYTVDMTYGVIVSVLVTQIC